MSLHFGYTPNPIAAETFAAQESVGQLAIKHPALMLTERRDVELWHPLLKCKPSWKRGSQGLGSCVAWGAELAATMLLGIQHAKGVSQWIEEASTEAIYGGCRVEAQGGKLGGWQDGSWGSAAAEWLRDWGVLIRIDYSKETGNPEHDLRTYDAKKEKNWGNFGCGGQRDERGKGLLDQIAAAHPVQQVTKVSSVEEAAAAIQNGYPISVASMVGYGKMDRRIHRGRDGIEVGYCKRSGQWAHQMMVAGVRWIDSAPWFRQFQSWGKSCSGPDPGINIQAVSWCSWWTAPDDFAVQLRADDAWAFSDVQGFPPQKIDWAKAVSTW